MKRILALDGGGIRGVFSLEVLLRIQELLRERFQNPGLVLADHFDMFAGTSTGAVIATCLCWGMPVEKIMDMYVEHAKQMFQPIPWFNPYKRYLVSRYESGPLSALLQRTFSEDGEGKEPALLGSSRLKKLLLVVVRNHSTGSAWPITNNPGAKFNQRDLPDCNLDVPLWKVVRASTAAPVYFDPEQIKLADRVETFVDGAMTPYNNPALIAALTAILPSYRMEWEPGPDNIRLISVGTIRFSISDLGPSQREMWLGYNLPRIPAILIEGIALQQDYLCRCLGDCIFGEEIDTEVGSLIGSAIPGRNWFKYVRYNKSYLGKTAETALREHPALDQIDAIRLLPLLREIGKEYAVENVRIEHLI